MKYSAIILGSLFSVAFAAPQASSTITQAPSVASYSQTPQQTCLASCAAGDVDCQAACVGVAHPNSSQVDETTQCAMKCDQGDGSPAATEKYSQCVQGCISSYFPTTQTVGGAVAGASSAASNAASATGSAAAAASSGASKTGSATGTEATGSSTASGAAASSSSTGAASVNNVQMGAAGLAGLFMAIFAL